MDSWVVPPLAIVDDAPLSTWVHVSDSVPLFSSLGMELLNHGNSMFNF